MVKEGPRDQVEAQLLQASADSLRIVLDERGKSRRSLELARWIEQHDLHGTKRASLIIGGADGHSEALRERADECWTLSSFTLQHEIESGARVTLVGPPKVEGTRRLHPLRRHWS